MIIAFNCSGGGGGATMEQHFCNFIVGAFPNESDDDSPKYKLIYIYIHTYKIIYRVTHKYILKILTMNIFYIYMTHGDSDYK